MLQMQASLTTHHPRWLTSAATIVAMVLALMAGASVASAAATGPGCNPYPDVTSSNPACRNIAWLKRQNITKPADGLYHPAASVNRGAMAAFLFRLTHPGAPSPTCASRPFPDVSRRAVFCGYIAWAKTHHVAFGYPDGKYGPHKAVTRGAMAAYLHRIATGQPASRCTGKPFEDVAVGSTFCGVIAWMKSTEITYGIGAGMYGTALPVTRQAMASFLHRMAHDTGITGRRTTKLKIFTPFSTASQKPTIPIVSRQSGSCWEHSVATNDPSAYRCLAGDYILDPCFVSPTNHRQVVCVDAPWEAGTLLTLATPLPGDSNGPAAEPGWALELANGARCIASTGEVVSIGGIAMYYSCTTAEGIEGASAGNLDTRRGMWTVKYLPPNGSAISTVDVRTAWG